jgi:hypothetical protein
MMSESDSVLVRKFERQEKCFTVVAKSIDYDKIPEKKGVTRSKIVINSTTYSVNEKDEKKTDVSILMQIDSFSFFFNTKCLLLGFLDGLLTNFCLEFQLNSLKE